MLPSNRNRRLLPLILASAVAFMALDAAGFGPINGLRRTVLSVGQPIRVVLSVATAPVGAAWEGAVHYDEVEEENRQLRRQVAELEGQLTGRPDVEAELRALLEATEIDYLGDTQQVTGRVIADRRTDLERIVELDKGGDHGIARGMPVVTGRGLVGTVELVTDDRSVIRLMTDGDVAVGVRSESGVGLAVGRRGSTMELRASPELAEAIGVGSLVDGERFVTSGVDRSAYPAGIPVGELQIESEVIPVDPGTDLEGGGPLSPAGPIRAPDQLSYEALSNLRVSLRPLADLDRLSYLTVLLLDPPA